MAKFVMREMPDMQGTGKRTMYPKMISRGTMGPDEIAELISSQSTFSPGEVKGLVAALARTIAYGVASGYTVKIEEIGSFSASLALRKGVESEEAEGGTRSQRDDRRGQFPARQGVDSRSPHARSSGANDGTPLPSAGFDPRRAVGSSPASYRRQ